jgi:hypothetical protein
MQQLNVKTTHAACAAMQRKLDKFHNELREAGSICDDPHSAVNIGIVSGQITAARDAITNAKISIEVYL